MTDEKCVHFLEKCEGNRPLGRPSHELDDIKMGSRK
jgi:hypothetical protein